ncbi:MAG: DUF2541 family protein [Saprospiraceae bacterium]
MKTILFSCLSFLVFGLVSMSFTNSGTLVNGWEHLGSRKVNYKVDRDEILVTAAEGRFTKLKFKAEGAPINMHKMKVVFRNGQSQEIALRNNIPAGGESRVIDLQGNRRIIQKVVFWYDTKNFAGKRATLHLWGKH